MQLALIFLVFCQFVLGSALAERPSEAERVRLWHEKGNVWPPNWQQDSEAHKAKNRAREIEIMAIPGARERWENWMQFVSGQLVPKFTKHGFLLAQTPPAVHAKLLAAVNKALEHYDKIPYEQDVEVIYGQIKPRFLDIGSLAWEVNKDLLPLHEEWGGVKLKGTSSYGVRFYQNGSSLVMHYDKIETHVISSIIHIAHEYDNDDEPWPIQIEDHDGNIHSVSLEPGQMLFYESSRQLHGRMSALKGKYYASIFTHYQPVDKSIWNFSVEDVVAAVPPHWSQGTVEELGSRWAGQGLTIDSLACAGAPARIVNGQFLHDIKSIHAEL